MIYKVGGVIVYLGILLWLGVLASRRMKDIKDYFAAGKNLGFLAVAFSARATGESAWLLIGLTGMGCALGVKAFWVVVGEVIGVVGAWFMSKRFKRSPINTIVLLFLITLKAVFKTKPNHSYCLRFFNHLRHHLRQAQIDATGKAFEDFWAGTIMSVSRSVSPWWPLIFRWFLSCSLVRYVPGRFDVFRVGILPVVAIASMGGISALTDGLTKLMFPCSLSPGVQAGHRSLPLRS